MKSSYDFEILIFMEKDVEKSFSKLSYSLLILKNTSQ